MAVIFCGCTFFQKITGKAPAAPEVAEVPVNVNGPAYDPSTSPKVMTSSTPLPTAANNGSQPAANGQNAQQPTAYGQASATTQNNGQPAAYGQNTQQPTAYGQTPAPSTYSAPATAAEMASKGGQVPTAYGNTTTMAPATGEQAVLAATLNGLWVNSVDPKEVVEFTTDHYSTFYEGQLLVQEPMSYHARCPGDCAGGESLEIACFTITGPAGTDCYGIIRMTPQVLELSLLGVSTETIIYRKQ